MIVGHDVVGQDNDSYMYYGDPAAPRCPKCGYVVDREYVNPGFKLNMKRYDLSHTYDGCTIVSASFKEFCEREKYSGVRFLLIGSTPEFYRLRLDNVVDFDAERRGTRFGRRCSQCDKYKSVIGATPCYLKGLARPLADGLYRTDLEFGDGDEKEYCIIVGVETARKMKGFELIGIDYEDCLG